MTRSANVLLGIWLLTGTCLVMSLAGCGGVSGAAQPPNFKLSANPSTLGIPWEATAPAPSP